MKTRLLAITAGLLMALGLGLVSGGTAYAVTQQQICDTSPPGGCMNNWNGANQYVKMYTGSSSHEDFIFIFYTTECGSGAVTSTCPFTDTNLDRQFGGDPIGAIEYEPTGQCIGTTSAGTAYMGACARNNGVGGGTGSTVIFDSLCQGGTCNGFVDRYWSDFYSFGNDWCPAYVSDPPPGTNGTQLRMVQASGNCSDETIWY